MDFSRLNGNATFVPRITSTLSSPYVTSNQPKSSTHGLFGPKPSISETKDDVTIEVHSHSDGDKEAVSDEISDATTATEEALVHLPTLVQKKKMKPRGQHSKNKKHLAAAAAIRETDDFVSAASEGRLEEVVYRIRRGQEVDATHSWTKNTALHGSATFGRDKCLRVILEYGATVDLCHEKTGMTAMHMASARGREKIVQILLDAGSDKRLKDKSGMNALNHCEEYHHDLVRAKLRDPPCAMAVPLALDFSTTHVRFSWEAPISLGADIIEYRLVWKICPGGPWVDATVPNPSDLMWDEEGFGYGDPINEIDPKSREYIISHLKPASTIRLAIRARNLAGYGGLSPQLTMQTTPDVPGIPVALTFIMKNATSASYSFSFPLDYGEPIDYYQFFYRVHEPDKNDAVACEIFRKAVADKRVDPGLWCPYPTKIVGSPCQIVNLEPGTTYDFKCRAHNAIGYSEFGAISDKIRTDDAPYLVRKTKFSITLAWTAQSGAFRYEMQYQEEAMGHIWATVSSAITRTEFTCDNLYPARDYRYRIRSFTDHGWSSYEGSALSQWIRTNDDIPDQPSIPTLANVGIWNIEIEWERPKICNGQPVDYYEVQQMQVTLDMADIESGKRTLEDVQVWKTVHQNCVSTKFNSESLEPGISYRYRCRAHNLIGWSEWGEDSENFTTKPTEPNQMKPPVGTILSPYSVELQWICPVENGRKVTVYAVEQMQLSVDVNDMVNTVESVAGWKLLRENIAYLSLVVDGLEPGLLYKYRVKAKNEVGWSMWSLDGHALETFPIAPFVPPIKPYPTCDSTSESITIEWKAPITNGAPIDAYEVEHIQLSIDPNDRDRTLADVTGWKVLRTLWRMGNLFSGPLDLPPMTLTSTELEPGTEYKYRVRCRNHVGWSPFTDCTEILRTKPIAPDQPRFPVPVPDFLSASSCGVCWQAPKTNGAPILEYQVDAKQVSVDLSHTALGGRDGGDGPEVHITRPWKTLVIADIMEHCMKDVNAGIQFLFRVRCRNAVGWSTWSESSEVLQTLSTPPDRVEGVGFSLINSRDVAICWSLPLCRGVIVDSYEIQHQCKVWINDTVDTQNTKLQMGLVETNGKEIDDKDMNGPYKSPRTSNSTRINFTLTLNGERENLGIEPNPDEIVAIKLANQNVEEEACLEESMLEASTGQKLIPGDWKTLKIADAPLRTFAMRGLLPFTEHRFRIRAHGHDWGKYSAPTPWKRTLPSLPSKPGAPYLTFRNDSLLRVKWEHYPGIYDSSISNGSTIVKYQLEWKVSRYGNWNVIRDDMVTEHDAWGCASVVPHWFRVRALNGEGWSEFSEVSDEMRPKRKI
jgi:hypothetical protein|eukprot:Stramenopile-MAST_4_protein_336